MKAIHNEPKKSIIHLRKIGYKFKLTIIFLFIVSMFILLLLEKAIKVKFAEIV